MTATRSTGALMACVLALGVAPTRAACPVELAVYGDRDDVAGIDFVPVTESVVATNAFRMVLRDGVVLDGTVMWSEGVERPYGMLGRNCPQGDVTGKELDACTVWQGVIYAADGDGIVGLLPKKGDAPQTLILADLGPALEIAGIFGEGKTAKLPFDVFTLKGCQE